MIPVSGETLNPFGKFSAENCMGLTPVAAIVYKNGLPGRTPIIFAEFILGVGLSFGVKIKVESLLINLFTNP